MTVLVDLFPTANRHPLSTKWAELERACEQIEATTGRPFSLPGLHKAIGDYIVAKNTIGSLLALGLIERISPPGARPVLYVVPAAERSTLQSERVA